MSRIVNVDIDHAPYSILIGQGLLQSVTNILPLLAQKRVAIVTNETIAPLVAA